MTIACLASMLTLAGTANAAGKYLYYPTSSQCSIARAYYINQGYTVSGCTHRIMANDWSLYVYG